MVIWILTFIISFSAPGLGSRESSSSPPVEGRFCSKDPFLLLDWSRFTFCIWIIRITIKYFSDGILQDQNPAIHVALKKLLLGNQGQLSYSNHSCLYSILKKKNVYRNVLLCSKVFIKLVTVKITLQYSIWIILNILWIY